MIPLISIVGRPNVGKSTLFNRLVGLRHSIIFKEPGSTRDLLSKKFTINNKEYELIDSGGFDKDKDLYPTLIRKKIIEVIKKSNLIIFLLDGKSGLQKEDFELITLIRKENKRMVTVINKIDYKYFDENLPEFYKLGETEMINISAEHDRNITELKDFIYKNIGNVTSNQNEDNYSKIAIVGKPNVGKSTLINKIADEEISIVSEKPGTTRDAVNLEIIRNKKKYMFIDTAGLRRKSKIYEKVEYYSTSRAIDTIENSNIAVFMIDSQLGPSKQDSKILNLIKKNNKAVIIVLNKSDLIPKELKNNERLKEVILQYFPQINYAKIIIISALEGKNINKIFKEIDEIEIKLNFKVNINNFNKFLKKIVEKYSVPVQRGKRFKIYYGSQTKTNPPEFIIFSNFAKNLPNPFRKFFERSIRKEYGFDGISFKLSFRTTRKE